MNLLKLNINKKSLIFYLIILALNVFAMIFIQSNIGILPAKLPMYYTFENADYSLTSTSNIFFINAISLLFATLFLIRNQKLYNRSRYELANINNIAILFLNILLIIFQLRIVNLVAFEDLIIPNYAYVVILPILLSFLVTYLLYPLTIKFAYRFNLIDDPLTHKHPGMLLKSPVPRAGGLLFFLGILLPALVLLPISQSQKLLGLLTGAAMNVLLGLSDDRYDMHPLLRAFIQLFSITFVVLAGFTWLYLPNPFGEAINLQTYSISFNFLTPYVGDHHIYYLAVLLAIVWAWFLMNYMSMANGTDGVYAGLVLFASIAITVILAQNLAEDPNLLPFIKLGSLMIGASLAMAIFTWPNNKILWGFGATAPALILAMLSIIGSTKVATTLIVLAIPFLDGIWSYSRRILRGQMPFWGDREHLHHKLLNIGLSKEQIAITYWSTAGILCLVGILTSGKTKAISLLSIVVILVFAFITINVLGDKLKKDKIEAPTP